MYYTRKDILEDVKESWKKILDNNKLNKILFDLNKISTNNIYPTIENIFETFKYFEINETRVIILGQDPYHNIKNNKFPQANGLAFSVNDEFPVPPSLRNIYKELKIEYPDFKIPRHGNLKRWVSEEKILLLNSSLTVEIHKAGSHMKYWQKYTDNIISHISNNIDNIIFILLGNFAQKKIKYINQGKINNNTIKIITAVHPSPLSANRGFFNSNIFIKSNDYLKLIDCYKRLYFSLPFNDKRLNYDILEKICKLILKTEINWTIK